MKYIKSDRIYKVVLFRCRGSIATKKKSFWRTRDVRDAINAVNNGSLVRQSAINSSKSEATLSRKMKLNMETSESTLGRPLIFSTEQASELANHVLKVAKLFHGMAPCNVRTYNYPEANDTANKFNNNGKLAGKELLLLVLLVS